MKLRARNLENTRLVNTTTNICVCVKVTCETSSGPYTVNIEGYPTRCNKAIDQAVQQLFVVLILTTRWLIRVLHVWPLLLLSVSKRNTKTPSNLRHFFFYSELSILFISFLKFVPTELHFWLRPLCVWVSVSAFVKQNCIWLWAPPRAGGGGLGGCAGGRRGGFGYRLCPTKRAFEPAPPPPRRLLYSLV
jgi:hypothetical protein